MSATNRDLMKIPYAEFVNGLFVKPNDLPGRLMHAAVGLIGEAVELRNATSRENEIEEAGDWEFYYQSFFNNCPAGEGVVNSKDLILGHGITSATQAADKLIYWSNELLDQCKKTWVYEKNLDAAKLLTITTNMRTAMEAYYRWAGFTYANAEEYNRIKLAKRYPGATYTDAAAIARADKENGQ